MAGSSLVEKPVHPHQLTSAARGTSLILAKFERLLASDGFSIEAGKSLTDARLIDGVRKRPAARQRIYE